MKPGLYERLITLALQNDLEALGDPRLYAMAPVDAEDAHSVIAQFLEHMLANGLAALRGGEAAERQQAINRRLLCPFQYFGVSDSVDLDGLAWQRGGYRVEDLDQVYTGNDVRALLILDKVHEILLNATFPAQGSMRSSSRCKSPKKNTLPQRCTKIT